MKMLRIEVYVLIKVFVKVLYRVNNYSAVRLPNFGNSTPGFIR